MSNRTETTKTVTTNPVLNGLDSCLVAIGTTGGVIFVLVAALLLCACSIVFGVPVLVGLLENITPIPPG